MALKIALQERKVAIVNSGAVAKVYLDQVHPGKIYCYQRISWEISLATALGNTRCRLIIEGHGYDIAIAEQQTPVADNLYWIHDHVWLHQHEELALLIDQPQDATTVRLHGIGYWVDDKEGVI